MSVVVTGLLAGLSLIVVIGAQNLFVLRQGLSRDHVGLTVAVCAVSDVLLVAVGASGVGALVGDGGLVLTVVSWAGAVLLAGYGLRTLWTARRPGPPVAAGRGRSGRGAVLGSALALTYLNPHVYLDTVLLLGSLGNRYGPQGRLRFAVGAALASVLWFSCLGYGARAAAHLLVRPRVRWVTDLTVGSVMIVVAIRTAVV